MMIIYEKTVKIFFYQ